MRVPPASLPPWAEWLGTVSDLFQVGDFLVVAVVFLAAAARGLRERHLVGFAKRIDTKLVTLTPVGSLQLDSHNSPSPIRQPSLVGASEVDHAPNVGRPYQFLPHPPPRRVCPTCGELTLTTASESETPSARDGETVPQAQYLSSPLESWVEVCLADSGRSVELVNRGWLPLEDLSVHSNPPVFRSAVSGAPANAVKSQRLDGQRTLTLHIDDVTLNRANAAAKFLMRPRMTVTLTVRFYDWLADTYQHVSPSTIDIPVSSAFNDDCRTSESPLLHEGVA